MEARGRRVGGFPGYNGPAPRAMRSSRGRGEATRRQSNVGGQSGFFELLATVAGQMLQDGGVEEDHGGQLGDKTVMERPSLEIDMPGSAREDLTNHALQNKAEVAATPFVGPCLDVLQEACREEEGSQIDADSGKDFDVVEVSNDNICASCEAVVWSLSEEDKAVVSVIPVDKGHITPLQKSSSTFGDEKELPLVCDGELPSGKLYPNTGSSAFGLKERASVREIGGANTEIKQCAPDNTCEPLKLKDDVLEMVIETNKEIALTILEDVALGDNEVESSLGVQEDPSDGLGVKIEYPGLLGELEPEQPVQHSSTRIVKESGNDTPDNDEKFTNLYDAKPGKPAEVGGAKQDNSASMEVEDKSVIVDTKNSICTLVPGSSVVATPGTVEGENISPRFKKVINKREGKFLQKEKIKGHRSSQRLLPETMTKRLKESYSKGLKARKVVKRSRVVGTRSKRKHADMESTDSGSSEDSMFGERPFFGGIAAFTRQRTARGLPGQRRMVDGSSKPSPELHVNTNNLMDMGYECVDGEPPAAAAKLRSAKAASVASSPTAKGPSKLCSKKSIESQVKFSIKSFTVPELFVDLPESASVASLKRAVMDAAMNMLGGGLRVRVLMQGKKVADEGATLSQMGISRSAKPDSLGFMLEPSPVPTSPSATSEDPLLVLTRAVNQPSPRYPVFGVPGLSSCGDGGGRCLGKGRSTKVSGTALDKEAAYGPPMAGDQQGYVDSKHAGLTFSVTPDDPSKGCNGGKTKPHLNERMSLSPHSTRVAAAGALAAIRAQADASRRAKNEQEPPSMLSQDIAHDSLVGGSGAIILHPGMATGDNVPSMALVATRQKISRSLDVGKRRVRRPFSVAEVEALVHAVEKHGTGRWRDVKLRAFDQAKHRTYVDLKDKWKTLVHTARIAPHQRRGEPVPQELLERVTRAHAYWTAHAAKQQAELDF